MGSEMHEVLITRGMWGSLPLELIMVAENCVLVHPGGKNFGSCHQIAHTREGRRTCARYLIAQVGRPAIQAWLDSLRAVAVSGVVQEVCDFLDSL